MIGTKSFTMVQQLFARIEKLVFMSPENFEAMKKMYSELDDPYKLEKLESLVTSYEEKKSALIKEEVGFIQEIEKSLLRDMGNLSNREYKAAEVVHDKADIESP